MRLPIVLLSAALVLGMSPAPSTLGVTAEEGPSESSPNVDFVANLTWDGSKRAAMNRPVDSQGGTDLEFLTIDERDYAFAGTYANGLQVIDITDPASPDQVATYDCQVLQGDVQTFSRGVGDDERFYVTYTADSGYTHEQSACYSDAGVTIGANARNGDGTLIIDVTDPTAPEAVGFAKIKGGSHNQTVDPSGMYLYNSNSGSGVGAIEVISIADVTAPKLVATLPTEGDESHDLTFNAEGTRAYSAALDHTLIIDTTDLANPSVVGSIVDPAITLHHQADPVTIDERDFVIINDELAGAAGNEVCPGGGLHVYDVTGELEAAPEKVGAFFIPEISVNEGARTGLGGAITCTSHVFRTYEEQELLVIAWFGAGVRVIDLSGLGDTPPIQAGAAGQDLPMGMREIGFYRFLEDSDAWSAKVFEFDEDGSAYIFANDQTRGFDVYRYDATAPAAADAGTWLTADQALDRALRLRASGSDPALLPDGDLHGHAAG